MNACFRIFQNEDAEDSVGIGMSGVKEEIADTFFVTDKDRPSTLFDDTVRSDR